MNESPIVVTGTINRESYLAISRFMLTPRFKLLFFAVSAAGVIGFAAAAILQRDLFWLVWAALWLAACCLFYRWNKKNVINRVMAQLHDLKKGRGYDLEIRFDSDAIRVHNRVTSRDTALAYEMFNSYDENDNCIALFIRTGEYLLIPRTNLSQQDQRRVMDWLHAQCRGLHRRRL